MKFKKILVLFLVGVLALSCLAGCGARPAASSASGNPAAQHSDKLQIVTTIFPEYDWVKEILGSTNAAEVTMLLDNGVDLHSYQPTVDDLMKVASADLFIYVGGESDAWVADALKEATNPDMVVINLLDVLGSTVKEEETVEGMQPEADEAEEATDDAEEGPEYDEHVWLSLKNTITLCGAIEKALVSLCPEQATQFSQNAADYTAKLSALDAEYQATVSAAAQHTLLFGDRFPFRYLTDDYGLSYYAAFVGCSAETEASFETVTFLAEKVDALGLKHVLTIETSDQKIAKTIIENTQAKNQDVLTLNSMQSITSADVANGASYLSIMQENLSVLKQALD